MEQAPDPAPGGQPLEEARAAMSVRAWDRARSLLAAADAQGLLDEPEDLERLAVSSRLSGRDDLAETAWSRAFDAFREEGRARPAVRCAFWLGMVLVLSGSEARGSGWIARAHRLLEEAAPRDCPEWGYVLLPEALRALDDDDPGVAHVAFGEAAAIGRRFGDVDLVALGRLGQGQALIRMGEAGRGMLLLDETMLAVDTGQVSTIVAGLVYCAVLIACQQVLDVQRAQEWTEAFNRWCGDQSGLVLFRGQCLVHRSQLAQLRGDWSSAVTEADVACRWLSGSADPAAGMAFYQRAELHRVRGEHAAAQRAYECAADRGHDPHPGLALLWLAQGRTDAAAAAIRRVVDQAPRRSGGVTHELLSPRAPAEALAAHVEITLDAGDVDAARRAAEELERISNDVGTTYLRAVAGRARGQVLLAQGRPGPALEELRAAGGCWSELRAPYEAARTRVLVGRALRDLGDDETAAIELGAANRVLTEIGATPGAAEGTPPTAADRAASVLTARELDVIRLVATGLTNREIAEELVISDKTVARHLHNVLVKLGLPNRSAATAYCYEHRLL